MRLINFFQIKRAQMVRHDDSNEDEDNQKALAEKYN
jgi:hypothetical protein